MDEDGVARLRHVMSPEIEAIREKLVQNNKSGPGEQLNNCADNPVEA